jgi:hypothetical protein
MKCTEEAGAGEVTCFHCNRADPVPDHFVEEWDAFLHGTCALPFLLTVEGSVVIAHRHNVVIRLEVE